MPASYPPRVVVAVGTDSAYAALALAAGEAVRSGAGVHLVHVVHHDPDGPFDALLDPIGAEAEGRRCLALGLRQARDLLGDVVPVTGELRWGTDVATTLAEAAADARLVVLQRRPPGRLPRVVTRSVSGGVAAGARVPVVSVPEPWSPPEAAAGPRTVVAGVDDPAGCDAVLRAAALVARERSARLRVVHAWAYPGAADDLELDPDQHKACARHAADRVRRVVDALADATDDLAGVPVSVEAPHAYPAEALVEAAADADLLVVGRHGARVPTGSHLGPVARAVLHEAACPVLLVDPVPALGARADDVRALAGAVVEGRS